MPSQNQKNKLLKKLKEYRKKYIIKKYESLDESATRIMVNCFLSEVLGYTELDEIKTEYCIKGTYADYVIQIDRKKHFIVEVKAMQLDLCEKHLRQAVNYAANEGVDWVLLTNGKQFELYRVIFEKPISFKKIFSYNLENITILKHAVEYFYLLTKKSVLNKELNKFWVRFEALEPINLCKYLFSHDAVRLLKRLLKKKEKINFSDEDILDSLYCLATHEVKCDKPKISRIIKHNKANNQNEKSIQQLADNNISSQKIIM